MRTACYQFQQPSRTGGVASPNQRLPVTDGLVAATGIEHKLTVVTRNAPYFERSGVPILNPFK